MNNMNNGNLLLEKNKEGKKLLYCTKLEYIRDVLKIFTEYPDIYNDLLEEMGVTAKELGLYLSDNADANIGFYDDLLEKVRKKVRNYQK